MSFAIGPFVFAEFFFRVAMRTRWSSRSTRRQCASHDDSTASTC